MNHPGHLALGLLSLLAAAAWLLLWSLQREPVADSGADTPRVDQRMQGVASVFMDEQGMPRLRLRGERLSHWARPDRVQVEAPRTTLYRRDAPPWELRAQQAWIRGEGKTILLQGRSTLWTEESDHEVALCSENITVHLEQGYLETDRRVRLWRDGLWLEGLGLRAYFDDGRYRLLRQVRGRMAATGATGTAAVADDADTGVAGGTAAAHARALRRCAGAFNRQGPGT